MAGRIELQKKYKQMLRLLSAKSKNPYKYIKAANALVIELADRGMNTDELTERIYFLTEGYLEKENISAGSRMRRILNERH